MQSPENGELRQDPLTLRISHLSRSPEVREFIVDAMNNGEDPFNLPDHTIAGIEFDIVGDDAGDFAQKLDQLIGSGAGDAYLEDAALLSMPYLRDTPVNRQHLWDWWKNAAASNSGLPDQIRQALKDALGQGSAVTFTGDYSGSHEQPEVVGGGDAQGDLLVRFRTDDVPHIEKP